jgi:hypothetical protein
MLEADDCLVSAHSYGNWMVTSSKGNTMTFEQDIGVCNRMPSVSFCKNKERFTMIKTVHKNFAGAVKRDTEKAYLVHAMQRRICHPPYKRFRELVRLGEMDCVIALLLLLTCQMHLLFSVQIVKESGGQQEGYESSQGKRTPGRYAKGVL